MQIVPNTSQFTALFSRLRREKPEKPRDAELHALILQAQQDIASCRRNLMFADSEALTDMYIYAIKSHELRYAHLLRMAKQSEAG